MRSLYSPTFATLLLFSMSNGCGGGSTAGNPAIEDLSSTGTAVSVVGAALDGSSASSALMSASLTRSPVRDLFDFLPEAQAANFCPTFHTASGAGCEANLGTLWLKYDACHFALSSTDWTGTLALTKSSGTAECRKFPSPGANGYLVRQYVTAPLANTPSTASATNVFGSTTTIDNASANLTNFSGDTLPTILNGGYGSKVDFAADGSRNALTVAHRVLTKNSDLSIYGSLTITETPGTTARALNGSVSVYHNKLLVIGTTTFSNIVHSDGCCYPTSGTITTQFRRGSVTPTENGLKAEGKSESLTLTGCGNGTIQNYDGTTADVTLTRCF